MNVKDPVVHFRLKTTDFLLYFHKDFERPRFTDNIHIQISILDLVYPSTTSVQHVSSTSYLQFLSCSVLIDLFICFASSIRPSRVKESSKYLNAQRLIVSFDSSGSFVRFLMVLCPTSGLRVLITAKGSLLWCSNPLFSTITFLLALSMFFPF